MFKRDPREKETPIYLILFFSKAVESKCRFLLWLLLSLQSQIRSETISPNDLSCSPHSFCSFVFFLYLKMDSLCLFLFLRRNVRRGWSWVSIWSSVGDANLQCQIKVIAWMPRPYVFIRDGSKKKCSCIVPKSSISSSQLSWKCCNLINGAIAKPLSWFLPLSNAYLHLLGDPIIWLRQNIKDISEYSHI